jgi:hypothetical protein
VLLPLPQAAKPVRGSRCQSEIRMKSRPVSAAQVRTLNARSSPRAKAVRERLEWDGDTGSLVNMIFLAMRLTPSDQTESKFPHLVCWTSAEAATFWNEAPLLCGWLQMRAPLDARSPFIAVR